MFYKIVLFKNFRKLTRKRFCQSFFLIELYTIKPATLLKRGFSSDILLWILQNCFKHLFYRTPTVSVSHFWFFPNYWMNSLIYENDLWMNSFLGKLHDLNLQHYINFDSTQRVHWLDFDLKVFSSIYLAYQLHSIFYL